MLIRGIVEKIIQTADLPVMGLERDGIKAMHDWRLSVAGQSAASRRNP